MKSTIPFRKLAAGALMAQAVLSIVSVVLQPDLSGDAGARLAAIDDAGVPAAVSAATFVLGQLPFAVALLAIAHLIGRGAPRLARTGGTLGVLGCFGHSVFGGIMLAEVVMAHDTGHRAVFTGLVEDIESTPVMVFAVLGLAGTVLGLLLLAIGLFRSRVVPAWIPGLLVAFLVIEFAGSGISQYASYLSGILLLVASVALARVVLDGTPSDATPVRA